MDLSKYPRMVAMLARRNPELIGKQMGPRKSEPLAGRVKFSGEQLQHTEKSKFETPF